MGFSNNMVGESEANDTSKGSGLEDRLAGYFKSRFPVAGGLAQAVFGGGGSDYQPQQSQPSLLNMMNQPPPVDSSLIGMNAMPKQGGGGGALLLKLLGLVKE